MRGAALPAALILAALACAVAFLPLRLRWFSIVAALALVTAFSAVSYPAESADVVFAIGWLVAILTALSVHLPSRLRARPLAIGVAVVTGCAAGSVLAIEGTTIDLARAVPALLLVLPFGLAHDRGYGIGVKIIASWIVAIAVMALVLPMVTTPGYVPDHMG